MRVLYTRSTGELELSGSKQELKSIGRMIRDSFGAVVLVTTRDARPYDGSLRLVKIECVDSPSVRIFVDWNELILRISGNPTGLQILGDNIVDFSGSTDPDEHLHVDTFPGHYYLAADSEPLVVVVDEDEISGP